MKNGKYAVALIALIQIVCPSVIHANGALKVSLKARQPLFEQLTTENTIYIVNSDFDLRGDSVTVPKGCTLKFSKGVLTNGVIVGQGTKLASSKKKRFGDDLKIEGSWEVEIAYSEWFGVETEREDNTAPLISFFNFPSKKKILRKGVYGVYELPCSRLINTEVYAYGAILKYLRKEPDLVNHDLHVLSNNNGLVSSKTERSGYLRINGLMIDGNSNNFVYDQKPTVVTSVVSHHTLRLVNLDDLTLKDCTFKNSFMTAVLLDVCNKVLVDNCSIINSGESQSYTPIGSFCTWEGVVLNDRVHTDKGWKELPCEECVVRNSYFNNIGGSFASANCRVFRCYNNTIIDNRGYAFELGFTYENRIVDIHDNTFNRVGSSAINMSGFHLPDSTTNIINIYKNSFIDLCYDSKRTRTGPKNFLMIYRDKKEDSKGILDVTIKDNYFTLASGTSQGLIRCDKFLFEGNTCNGFSGGNNRALFFCGDDENQGSYIIRNNTMDFNSGAVSIIRSPKYLEVSGNSVKTSLSPAVVYVQGNERTNETIFSIHDNEVEGVAAMAYVSSPPKMLEIYKNNSTTITEAITRPSSDFTINCKFGNNSFKNVAKGTKNIKIIEYGK